MKPDTLIEQSVSIQSKLCSNSVFVYVVSGGQEHPLFQFGLQLLTKPDGVASSKVWLWSSGTSHP